MKLSYNKKYERCVHCGVITDVLKNKPVDIREYYILGVGQLCRKCYIDIYARK